MCTGIYTHMYILPLMRLAPETQVSVVSLQLASFASVFDSFKHFFRQAID